MTDTQSNEEHWQISTYRAVDKTGAIYWVANGFFFFKAENRPVQLPLWERWRKWRSFKKQAIRELTEATPPAEETP